MNIQPRLLTFYPLSPPKAVRHLFPPHLALLSSSCPFRVLTWRVLGGDLGADGADPLLHVVARVVGMVFGGVVGRWVAISVVGVG